MPPLTKLTEASPLADLPSASTADIGSAIAAILFVLLGFGLRKAYEGSDNTFGTVVNDLLKGATFFPFLLLAMSIWHNRYLEMLISSNRLVLFLSGLIAGLYIVGEFVRQAQGKVDNAGGVED